jgi:hypothetical protein
MSKNKQNNSKNLSVRVWSVHEICVLGRTRTAKNRLSEQIEQTSTKQKNDSSESSPPGNILEQDQDLVLVDLTKTCQRKKKKKSEKNNQESESD